MSCNVVLLAGPARSGKTSRLLSAYRRVLDAGEMGAALWLAPTHRSVSAIQGQLADGASRGYFSPNCHTFAQMAERVLAVANASMRPVSPLVMRRLIKRLIDENLRSGRLRYFAPIAGTRGLVDLVVAFVSELKRLEIWPQELAAAHGPQASDKDRELCDLYRQYQELLLRHDLYDSHGRFWAARALLKLGEWGPLEHVKHVFVDGFTDFTRTEHEVLEILAKRVESLSISLPLEADSHRSDLFAKPTRTLKELKRRHPRLSIDHLPRRQGPVAVFDHLERRLFGNPKTAVPADDTRGIEIIGAGGTSHEIELIARRIKGLLTQRDADNSRVAAADILVVFRSLTETADLVDDVFTRYGIPHVIASAPALESAPIAQALVAWLRLDAEDWPFRQTLAVLSHNYFRPDWPEWRGGRATLALEHLVRALEIPSGRDELVRNVERLASLAATGVSQKQRLSPQLLRAQMAAPLLGRICAALDALPQRATPGDWVAALHALATSVGLFHASDANPLGTQAIDRDRAAWERLTAGIAELERSTRWTSQTPRNWSRRELLENVEELLGHETLPLPNDEAGCVRVLSAEGARNLSAPYVFLAGLAEKAFPPASREDCIHSDAERRQLAAAGLPFAFHALDSRFEMLLFYEMVTRATRQLVLSYPALDPAAQPLTPSPYLSEVQRACGAGRIKTDAQPHLTSVPADDEVRSPRDFRVRAISQALVGEGGLLAELRAHPAMRATADNVLASLEMSDARHKESFGAFEGMLPSPAAKRKLSERYAPNRCWSPSQLEQYAFCPFQFFMEHVLHASPTSEPQLAIDYMQRGRMLHWLLSSAHRRLNELVGEPTSPGTQDREKFMEIARSLADELRAARADRPLARGMLEIDVRKIYRWITDYYGQHVAYEKQWSTWELPPRPVYFEVSFGPKHDASESDEEEAVQDETDPLSTTSPFELDCGGETFLFSGRIDRIDLGRLDGQEVFNIVDYKSGAGSKRFGLQAVEDGYALQLPLYALAARWLLRDRAAVPHRAAYWHVAGKGYREKDAVKFDVTTDESHTERASLESRVRQRVRSLVEGVRDGQFPMYSVDEHCTGRCPFNTVCRVNQTRWLEKTWQPPQGSTK